MPDRCDYQPTSSGHCSTCGGLVREACPRSGQALVIEGDTTRALRNLGDALKALGASFLKTLSELIERTVDDDRS